MEEKVVQRVPLWLAVAVTVLVSLPMGLLLKTYNIPIFITYIAWASYFALGAKPAGLKTIFLMFPCGALYMTIFAVIRNYLMSSYGWNPIVSIFAVLPVVAAIAIYISKYHEIFTRGSLPFFNGFAMYLALYLGGAGPGTGGGPVTGNPFTDPFILWAMASVSAMAGGLLGWFTVAMTFPMVVSEKKSSGTGM